MKTWAIICCLGALLTGSNAAEETISVKAVPTGASAINIDPLKLDFGTLPVGGSSQPMASTLTNPGGGAVKIVDITASGIDFAETNTCSDSLPAGSSCQIQVTFKPAISGPRLGVVSVMVSGASKPSYIVLTGVGQ